MNDTRIDRYRIERVIGRDGMGSVYLAHDPELNRPVALKRVPAETFVNRESLHARLLREARVLARLTHPNVVGVYDVGTHEGELFVAMEYVSGTDLQAWQRSRHRSSTDVLAAYLQAARGLAALHRVGLVHRDFDPDDVLVSDEGRVLVGGFGLVEGESAGEAGDQPKFCAALWEALAGHAPPRGGGKLPGRIRRVLERGLAPDPRQRYADFESLLAALDQRHNRGKWLAAIGLLGIAAIVIRGGMSEPETERCEVADRLAELDEATLRLPEASSASASAAVRDRFDGMVDELRGQAIVACQLGEATRVAGLDRWVDQLERVADHSDEVAISRTLDSLAELQFERDRDPPELIDPEVARLIDEAREHIAMGRLVEAERVTERAAAITGGHSDRAEVSLRLGQLAAWRGEPATAHGHYEDAIESADAAGLDRLRLAAHLLATPIALTRLAKPELAEDHHRRAALLLERIGSDEDAPARIDHQAHEASFANERGDFETALAIQRRVLELRIESGDPLAAADARKQLALFHHSRANVAKDPAPDMEAAATGYRRVLAELEALDVAASHPVRLTTLMNLGLLLLTPDATDEQLDEVWKIFSMVVEAGRSSRYLPAMHMKVAMLVERHANTPSPELLVEAERLGTKLELELQNDDLAPRVRLETWIGLAQLQAVRGDLVALEAADATIQALADSALAQGVLSAVDHDLLLIGHAMQIVSVVESTNPELAQRHALRAAELAAELPPEATQHPDVASMVAEVADAADASNDRSSR